MTQSTELHLPDGAEMRVYAAHRISLGDHQSQHRWPFVRAAGKVFDFLRPFDVAKQYACKLFLDVPDGRGRAVLRQDGAELEVTFDSSSVGHFGLWLNKHGWTPLKKEAPYLNLAFEPCVGAPDTLSDEVEPYLLREQFIVRSPRGRIATMKAYVLLGRPPKKMPEIEPQRGLFDEL